MKGEQEFYAALEDRLGSRFHDIEAEFRARYRTTPTPRRRAISSYVLHHTAGGMTMSSVWEQHVRANGWNQGGYAIGVDKTGNVYWAVSPRYITHGAGPLYNDKCFYVVALGNYEVEQPSSAMLDAIYNVFCAADDHLGFKPWRGHCELKATACPGQYLFSHLKLMRGARYGDATPRPQHYP